LKEEKYLEQQNWSSVEEKDGFGLDLPKLARMVFTMPCQTALPSLRKPASPVPLFQDWVESNSV
jgi:hypothetical protein